MSGAAVCLPGRHLVMIVSMKTVSKSIVAKNLPLEWQQEGEFAPDDRVTLTVVKEDPALTALRAGLDEAAAQLDRGEGAELTPEDFEAIKRRGRERRTRSS